MDTTRQIFNAFLAGFGGAFALFPAGNLDRFMTREPTQQRMYQNFKRVGNLLDDAMGKAEREQEKRA